MNRVALMGSAASFLLLSALGGFKGSRCALGQSPALAPASAPPADAVSPNPSAVALRPGLLPPRLAMVVYAQGRLEVTANSSSLHQILYEIRHQTGMTIIGPVVDERVFGKYGPGAPAAVLSALLYGTKNNMLLRETAQGAPETLILTPRQDSTASSAAQNSAPIAAASASPLSASMAAASGANSGGIGQADQAGLASASAPAAPLTPDQVRQRIEQFQQTQQSTRQH